MAALLAIVYLLATSVGSAIARSSSLTGHSSLLPESSFQREASLDAAGKWEIIGNELRNELMRSHSHAHPVDPLQTSQTTASEPVVTSSAEKPLWWIKWWDRSQVPALPPWAYPVPAYPHHYPVRHSEAVTSFVEHARSKGLATRPSYRDFMWLLLLVLCLGLAGWQITRLNEQLKVEGNDMVDSVPGHGHIFWFHLFSAGTVTITIAVFTLAWLEVSVIRLSLSENTQLGEELKEEGLALKLDDSGWRAFESGIIVVLSVLAGSYWIFGWRKEGSVKLNNALISQLAVRGASIALLAAIILEIVSSKVFRVRMKDEGDSPSQALISAAKITLIAGINEEFAKAFSVTWDSVTTQAALASRPTGCCGHQTILLNSPQAMMIAGLSVGLGFMTIENASYIIAMVVVPMAVPVNGELDPTEETLTWASGLLVVIGRVAFNLHPWLAGLTSGRMARSVFATGEGRTMPLVMDFLIAMLPSALIHSAYDFALMTLPINIGMCAPPAFWLLSYALFAREFRRFCAPWPSIDTTRTGANVNLPESDIRASDAQGLTPSAARSAEASPTDT